MKTFLHVEIERNVFFSVSFYLPFSIWLLFAREECHKPLSNAKEVTIKHCINTWKTTHNDLIFILRISWFFHDIDFRGKTANHNSEFLATEEKTEGVAIYKFEISLTIEISKKSIFYQKKSTQNDLKGKNGAISVAINHSSNPEIEMKPFNIRSRRFHPLKNQTIISCAKSKRFSTFFMWCK